MGRLCVLILHQHQYKHWGRGQEFYISGHVNEAHFKACMENSSLSTDCNSVLQYQNLFNGEIALFIYVDGIRIVAEGTALLFLYVLPGKKFCRVSGECINNRNVKKIVLRAASTIARTV